jgi:N-acetylneuraminic acid mutarotase
MPTIRSDFSTCVVDGKIFVIGGSLQLEMDEYGDQSLSTVEMYDPETDAWAGKANMPTVRSNVSVSVVDGKIYAIGGSKMKKIQVPRGFRTGSEELPTVEMYDPATDTWTQKADMPTPRKTKTCVVDSKIYAIGGWLTTNEQSQLDTVEVYDPATDTWAKAQSMNHARCSAAISVVNGEIYAVGGIGWPPNRDQSGRYLSSPYLSNVEVFNPKTNQWQERTEMSVPKANHSTSVIDGKIYVMGGYFQEDRKVKSLSAIEVYDPATDRWTQESDMLIGRSGHTTEVVDGQIYILGGIAVGKGLLTSVEVYDLREVSQRVNSTGKL